MKWTYSVELHICTQTTWGLSLNWAYGLAIELKLEVGLLSVDLEIELNVKPQVELNLNR